MITKKHLIILILVIVALGAWYAFSAKTDMQHQTQPTAEQTEPSAAAVEQPSSASGSSASVSERDAYFTEDRLLGWSVRWTQPSEAGALFDGTESVQELLVVSPSGKVSLRLEELAVTDEAAVRAQITSRYPTLAVPEHEAYIVPFAGMVSDSGLVLLGHERILTINPTDGYDWPLTLDTEISSFLTEIQVP